MTARSYSGLLTAIGLSRGGGRRFAGVMDCLSCLHEDREMGWSSGKVEGEHRLRDESGPTPRNLRDVWGFI